MKNNVIKLFGLFSLLGILTTACNKTEDNSIPGLSASDLILAMDDIAADEIYTDIDASVEDKVVELESASFEPFLEKSATDDFTCLEVNVDYPDSTRFPKVITFDYGTGCSIIINGDTITKEGKMIITLTDHFLNAGAQRIVTFEDYYVNEMKVEGILTNTFIGRNEAGNLEFELTVEDGKLIFADEDGNPLEYTREARFQKEWDRELRPIEDTVYLAGSAWGVNADGENYSREIVDHLTLVHCLGYGRRWVIVDGSVVSMVGDVETISDYSDGGCDGTVELFREHQFQQGPREQIRIRTNHRNRHNGNGGN